MSRNDNILGSLDKVIQACGPPDWCTSDSIRLTVNKSLLTFPLLRDLETCDLFVDSLSHPSEASLQTRYNGNDPGEIPIGSVIVLRVPRVVSRAVVAKDLADLLSVSSATWQEPRSYFLIAEEESQKPYCFTCEASLADAPPRVRRYHSVLGLWGLLREQADYVTSSQALLFFGIRRTEILPRYEVADLREEIALQEIHEFITNPDRQKTRREIFRSVLSELLRDQQPERAFAYLLRVNTLFARRLKEGLAIYLATHSPEKLAEEAAAQHLELAERLEKVISGIEAKSLSIPAAVLLAIKEVKLGEGWITLNTIILAAALLYLIAMTVAHFSQRAMLKLLNATIHKTTNDLKDQGLAEANPVLSISFSNLSKRQKNSSLGSWLMWVFSSVPIIAVSYAVFFAPTPVGPSANSLPTNSAKTLSHQPSGPAPSSVMTNHPRSGTNGNQQTRLPSPP
jgi:hypothetical protein